MTPGSIGFRHSLGTGGGPPPGGGKDSISPPVFQPDEDRIERRATKYHEPSAWANAVDPARCPIVAAARMKLPRRRDTLSLKPAVTQRTEEQSNGGSELIPYADAF